jgi:hypothetical protein
MQEIAMARSGECISDNYVNGKTHLYWRCAIGHEWSATPNNVKNCGSWCPKCKINVGEEMVLQEAFPNKLFERTRREEWLAGLELDGYNPELRLAFEYQGVQHFRRIPHFHRTTDAFDAQLTRDALKAELCQDEEVTLLAIPYTIKHADLRIYVRELLEELGYRIAPIAATLDALYAQIRTKSVFADHQFARALAVIATKGGECLSTCYVSYRSKLEIKCCKGHIFYASLEDIDQPPSRGPRFCYYCGGTRKRSDGELRDLVRERGFTFIKSGYRPVASGARAPRRTVDLICPVGHVMPTVDWDNFNKKRKCHAGNGCVDCANVARGDAHRNSIAKWCERYEINPAGHYKNASTNVEWRCAIGHRFTAKHVCMATRQSEGREACIDCDLVRIEYEYNIKLLTKWTSHHGPSTLLDWLCHGCTTVFQAPKNGVTDRNKLCGICVR